MRYVILTMLLAALVAPAAAAPAARPFPETGYSVDGRFLQFWERNGGLPVFGLPISEQRRERGSEGSFEVQWFERERFERHPENQAPYDVLLGRLGDEALRRQGRDWRGFPPGEQQPGCLFFAETSHALCEPFLSYWQNNGLEIDGRGGKSYAESLALFGLPLSEPMMEANSSGLTVLTQWFERARFEYLPDNPDPYKVLLGRLGAEVFAPGRANLDPLAGEQPRYRSVQQPGWPTPLEVPAGFTVEEAAGGVPSPRFMALDPANGSLVYGSATTSQVMRLIDTDRDGRYDQQQVVAGGLRAVHSVAFVDGQLYAAAEDRLLRLADFDQNGTARRVEKILDLPAGARGLYGHRTRTLLPAPDGKLYLSVGSSCDVCEESTPLRAAVLRLNPDGSGVEVFADGLRNTVGLAFHPATGELWGVDMGRNNLGPGLPPDELNLIRQGGDYGWPYCYSDRAPNPEFNDPGRCAATDPPRYSLPAHQSPLGLLFYDQAAFPASYQGDALIALHGSAADQTGGARLGCSVVRVRFKNGQPVASEELLRGFVIGGDAWGRPAGLLLLPDGSLLVSDDFGGRIFRVRYTG